MNIDRRIGFLLHPRFHRIMFNSETNRERERESCSLSVYVGRITGSLTPPGLSSINLAQSNAPRCVKYDYSAPKMSQLVERPSSHRHFSPTIRSIIDTNFIESIRFNTRVFPTKSPSDHAVVSKLDTLTDILLIFESLVIARIISRIICFRRCIAELFLRLSLVHE